MLNIYTHYDNLKVARNAPPEVIRAAYKSLSQKYHPDRNSNNPDAARVMALINGSYEVLSDTTKRAEHDKWIAEKEFIAPQQQTPRARPQPAQPPKATSNSVTFKSAISHIFKYWVIYGIAVAVINLFDVFRNEK